ncbi:MAG: NTP transferase domain-containing protein [Solirubrobacterales bacterium]|nr:NTP transferase domain-containing protein [Solirubrobacterales bacterium]
MQCVVLAGGLGTRLGQLTKDTPKALIPVAGRPFADHQLQQLHGWGVDDVIYSIGFGGDQIREFVGDGSRWGLSVRYADEGDQLRGTAGALVHAQQNGLLADTFALIYGDSYLQLDAAAVFDSQRRSDFDATMTVYRNDGRWDTSNTRVAGNRVELYEKGHADPLAAGMQYIDYGFSVLDRDAVLALIPRRGAADLADVYHQLSRAGRLGAFEVSERFYEIGSHSGLAELDQLLNEKEGNG